MVEITVDRKQRFYADAKGIYAGSVESDLPVADLVEIPAPPQTMAAPEYKDGVWREHIPSTDPRDYNLTSRQFNHMAALAGYDDAIDAILIALKASNTALYAEIKAGVMGSQSFHFDKVLAIIANPAVAPLIPGGVDVTETTLTANWLAAKEY